MTYLAQYAVANDGDFLKRVTMAMLDCAQDVAAEVRGIEPGYPGVLDKDVAHRRRTTQRAEGHLHLHEQMPGRRMRRPAVAEVACQHLGHRDHRPERCQHPDDHRPVQTAPRMDPSVRCCLQQ